MKRSLKIVLWILSAVVLLPVAAALLFFALYWNAVRIENAIIVKEGSIEFPFEINSERDALLYAKAIDFYPLETMRETYSNFKNDKYFTGSMKWHSSAKKTESDSGVWEIYYRGGPLPSIHCLGQLSSTGVIVKPLGCGYRK